MKQWIGEQFNRAYERPARMLLAGFVLASVIVALAIAFGVLLYVIDFAAKAG